MKLLLDTNRLSDFFRGEHKVKGLLEQADQIFVPFVVLAEIRAGALAGTQTLKNEARLQLFMNHPNINALYADQGTIGAFAELSVQLKRAGTPIPHNDLWIAALAIQHQLKLVTRDYHFQRIPQLILI